MVWHSKKEEGNKAHEPFTDVAAAETRVCLLRRHVERWNAVTVNRVGRLALIVNEQNGISSSEDHRQILKKFRICQRCTFLTDTSDTVTTVTVCVARCKIPNGPI